MGSTDSARVLHAITMIFNNGSREEEGTCLFLSFEYNKCGSWGHFLNKLIRDHHKGNITTTNKAYSTKCACSVIRILRHHCTRFCTKFSVSSNSFISFLKIITLWEILLFILFYTLLDFSIHTVHAHICC